MSRTPFFNQEEIDAVIQEMEQLYVIQKAPLKIIGERYGIKPSTVCYWTKKFNFPRRRRLMPPKNDLAKLRNNGWSIKKIAENYGCQKTTVFGWLQRYGIYRGKINKINISGELLILMYSKAKLSPNSIAKIFGCSKHTIQFRLKKLGINRRNHHKAMLLWGKNHSGPNHHFWQGGILRNYNCNWDELRQIVLKRDDYTCQKCGTRQKLDIHHKERFIKSKSNALDNLITLCRKCHMKIERLHGFN